MGAIYEKKEIAALQRVCGGQLPLIFDQSFFRCFKRFLPMFRSDPQISFRLVPLPRSYSEEQKINILKICKDTNIASIAEYCRFPDWLGYLGLILQYMYTRSNYYKAVSISWASQLINLVSPISPIHDRLCEITSIEGELLNIKDLELCETAIFHMSKLL